jgi:hypothetical protein
VSIVFRQIHTDNEAVNNSIRCLEAVLVAMTMKVSVHLNSSEARLPYILVLYAFVREVSKACIGRVTHCTHRLIRDTVSLHGVAGVAVTPVTLYSVQNDIMPNEFSRARNFNGILIVTMILCTALQLTVTKRLMATPRSSRVPLFSRSFSLFNLSVSSVSAYSFHLLLTGS